MPIIAIKTLLAALFHAVATKPMMFWALRRAVKYSNTSVDDNTVELVIAMESGKVDDIQKAIKKLVEEWDVKL